MKKHLSILLVCILVFGLIAAGCGQKTEPAATTTAPAATTPAAAKTDIVIALQGEPTSLDPQFPDDGNMRMVTWQVFEPLFKIDAITLEAAPCLAADYKVVDDSNWQFTIREGVKWHDGTAFTAEDAAYSVNRVIDPAFGSQILSDFSTIKGAKVGDDGKSIIITTDGPDPILLKRLTKLDMVQKAFYEGKKTEEVTKVAMGCGPYVFKSWEQGKSIEVEAFADYWGEKPAITKATFRFIEEPVTRLSALKTGEINIAVNMYPEYAADMPKIFTEVGLETYWIRFNQFSGVMKDKNMRLAANYAIDLQGLSDALFLGYAAPCQGQMGRKGYFGYNDSLADYGYDPAKAAELMKAAGYNGEEVELLSERGRWLKDGELTEAIAAQLTEAGFNVTTKFVSWNEWLDTLFDKAKTPDMQYSSTSNEFFDMDRTYSALVASTGTQAGLNNPEYDAIITAARKEMDVAKREAMYKDLASKLHDDPFAMYLLVLNDLHGGSENLNWAPRQDSRVYVSELSFN